MVLYYSLFEHRTYMDDTHEKSQRAEEDFDFRLRVADQIPFFMRIWWLRDFDDNHEIAGDGDAKTLPLSCLHSDPLCDVSNIDNFSL